MGKNRDRGGRYSAYRVHRLFPSCGQRIKLKTYKTFTLLYLCVNQRKDTRTRRRKDIFFVISSVALNFTMRCTQDLGESIFGVEEVGYLYRTL